MADFLAMTIFVIFLGTVLWTSNGYALHYYDQRNFGDGSPASVEAYLSAWLRECWYSFVGVIAYPLGWLMTLRRPQYDPPGGPPIVLVHGYMMNAACMFTLAWRLRRIGYTNIYYVNLLPPLASIEALGAHLLRHVERISKQCNDATVVGIGHSMGGLLLRWAATQGAPLNTAICIGTPHRGTRCAVLALGANGRQMQPESPFLTELEVAEAQRSNGHGASCPVLTVYSTLDQVVVPPDTANFGERVIEAQHCGHISLLYDSRVFAGIETLLEGARREQRPGQAGQGKGKAAGGGEPRDSRRAV